jgi:ketosteroid isomerase-like protein
MPDAIDDLFRRFGKAFNKADVEEIAACVTEDFEWRLNAGGSPAGAVLKGKDALRAYFGDRSRAQGQLPEGRLIPHGQRHGQ